ncbi:MULTISPECIES: hypothetical protein [Sphingomonadaceae]|jgi:hypothetical protein|uniref:TraR/DksA family transcriptional regulator n=4 Tax=Sphingomonadaceae TaxID=41297 RepID=A0A397PJ50_9SPHN|nr:MULTISPECIES: hypothetical protein [Sphingomonadaceae]AMG73018.1 TraR/DksA family transcriptional regulator [Sphingopyxis granuli]AMK18089.1 TraR/DksA family transcriptional regulator [Sphingobium sp. MI1205]KEQ55607.1 TraR/DksA family transcriptional regulator [Sphingobium chlorophenolicum]QUT05383.1 hypothetical protein KFK14_20775 [Sphingobium phenoxybenzoativorans]RIA46174.1 hypothetical protein DFR49_0707 [Hephaestia caeni]
MEDDAALEGQTSLLDREIAPMSRALERIRRGAYGECLQLWYSTSLEMLSNVAAMMFRTFLEDIVQDNIVTKSWRR